MTRSIRALLALLLGAPVVAIADRAAADPPVIVPLAEYAAHYDISEKYARRFVLNRCSALYIFAAAITKGHPEAGHAAYAARAHTFLGAAKAAADKDEVLLMLLTSMSNAYRRSADSEPAGEDRLAHPFFRSELAFCEDYAATLAEPPARSPSP